MEYEKTQDEIFRDSIKLKTFEDAFEDGWDFLNRTYEGYEVPWKTIQTDFKFIKGELNLWSGYTGQGKSEIVSHIALHVVEQGAKVFVASLEMCVGQLQSRMVTQATGVSKPTKEFYKKASIHYGSRIQFYHCTGSKTVEEVLREAELLVFAGYDFFIFDNLMMLGTKTDDYNRQLETVQKLSEFTKKYKVCSVLVAHCKKPQHKISISDKSKSFHLPDIYDVSGASSVANIVDNHISITINKYRLRALKKMKEGVQMVDLLKHELEALNTGDTILKRDKKREYGDFFIKSLFYDARFRILKDYENQQLRGIQEKWGKENE